MSIIIREVKDSELEESTRIIRNSFITVANEFDITLENAPTNPAFIGLDSLLKMKEKSIRMFGAFEGIKQVGFVAIEEAGSKVFYMEKVSILPKYRHKGYGKKLIDFVFSNVEKLGGRKVSIALINENIVLKKWYSDYGFIETGIKTFEHLPFTVCFMEKELLST